MPPTDEIATTRRLPVWLKWSAFVGAVVATLVGLVLFILPMGLNQSLLRTQLEQQIADLSGMTLSVDGDVAISFFPFKATLTDVTSKDALGPVTFTAKRIEARFSVLSALRGRVAVKEVLLDGADVVLRARADMNFNSIAQSGALKPAIEIAKAAIDADYDNPDFRRISNFSLGSVRLSNSTISLIWPNGREDIATDVNGGIDWLTLRGIATMSGRAVWRGEEVRLGLSLAKPLLLASGGTSAGTLNFTSGPLTFGFNGDFNLATDFFAEGSLKMKTPSISEVFVWIAAPMSGPGNLTALEIASKLTVSRGKLQFGDLLLLLAEKTATGRLELDLATIPPKFSGTLAFDRMNFAKFGKLLPFTVENDGVGTADLTPLSGLDLDLRISTKTIVLGSFAINNAAGTVLLNAGEAQFDLGSGEFGGGGVSANFQVKGVGSSRRALLKFSAHNVIPGQLSENASLPKFDAPVNLQFDLSGPYKTLLDFLRSGEGTFSADASSGIIRNFSADSFFGAVRYGQIFALPEIYSGLSTLESAVVNAKLKQGAALLQASEVNINGQRIVLTGAVPYASGGVALNGVIAAQNDPGNWMPFFIGGSWDKPFVTLVPLPK